jgi:hypothetical protein
MYKVDIETLKEVTKTLDAFVNLPQISFTGSQIIDSSILRIKARRLSNKIKYNYTEIKI